MAERKNNCPIDEKPINEGIGLMWLDKSEIEESGVTTIEIAEKEVVVVARQDPNIPHNSEANCIFETLYERSIKEGAPMRDPIPCFKCRQEVGYRVVSTKEC